MAHAKPETQISTEPFDRAVTAACDPNLVFDLGMNNGDDAAYYLHLGYRVVGIEANPFLAEECAHRFEVEIQQGRMKIVNVGVLKEPGEFTFYRNLSEAAWSSFDPVYGKKGGEWHELAIPCVTMKELIVENGRPFFIKIDIEGADFEALHSITGCIAPAYISVELNCTDNIIERLIELGYSEFKLISGDTHRSTPPIFDQQACWRLLRKLGRLAPFVRSGIRRLPQRCRPYSEYDEPGAYSPDGYSFGPHASGPFGEHAAGPWLEAASALSRYHTLNKKFHKAGKENEFWWDVHARRSQQVL